jgi:hypothetical protein
MEKIMDEYYYVKEVYGEPYRHRAIHVNEFGTGACIAKCDDRNIAEKIVRLFSKEAQRKEIGSF